MEKDSYCDDEGVLFELHLVDGVTKFWKVTASAWTIGGNWVGFFTFIFFIYWYYIPSIIHLTILI